MHEHTNEKISQFLDNELNANESMTLMQQMLLDKDLKNRLLRYEAIGQALKTESFIMPRADFLDRIHQELEHEPVYLLPQRKQPLTIKPQHKMLALVASATLIAVILPKDVTTINGSQMKAASAMTQAQRQAKKNPEAIIKQLPLNTQINDYMQAQSKNAVPTADKSASHIAETAAFNRK